MQISKFYNRVRYNKKNIKNNDYPRDDIGRYFTNFYYTQMMNNGSC